MRGRTGEKGESSTNEQYITSRNELVCLAQARLLARVLIKFSKAPLQNASNNAHARCCCCYCCFVHTRPATRV